MLPILNQSLNKSKEATLCSFKIQEPILLFISPLLFWCFSSWTSYSTNYSNTKLVATWELIVSGYNCGW